MGGLVEFLGIKGDSKTKGEAWSEDDIVGNVANATIVHLGLNGSSC